MNKDISQSMEWLFSKESIRRYNFNQYQKEYNKRPEVKARKKQNEKPYDKLYNCPQTFANLFVERMGKKFVSVGELKVLVTDYSKNAAQFSNVKASKVKKLILSNNAIQYRISQIRVK